jgi:hypothetical protein
MAKHSPTGQRAECHARTQSRGFDDDQVELVPPLNEPIEGLDEVTTNSTADATVIHLHDVLLVVELLLHQGIVNTHLTAWTSARATA